MTIENFQLPSYCHYVLDGNQIFLLATKGESSCFWKAFVERFSKTFAMPPFLATKKL